MVVVSSSVYFHTGITSCLGAFVRWFFFNIPIDINFINNVMFWIDLAQIYIDEEISPDNKFSLLLSRKI